MPQFSKKHPVGYYVMRGGLHMSMMFGSLSQTIEGVPEVGTFDIFMEVLSHNRDAAMYPVFVNKTRKEMLASMGKVLQFVVGTPATVAAINDMAHHNFDEILKAVENAEV